jgi:hypothetical protein
MAFVHDTVVPVPRLADTVSVFPDMEPVTVAGFGGRVPASYPWIRLAIWARRQAQSSLVVTRVVPSSNKNGSGSFELL